MFCDKKVNISKKNVCTYGSALLAKLSFLLLISTVIISKNVFKILENFICLKFQLHIYGTVLCKNFTAKITRVYPYVHTRAEIAFQ